MDLERISEKLDTRAFMSFVNSFRKVSVVNAYSRSKMTSEQDRYLTQHSLREGLAKLMSFKCDFLADALYSQAANYRQGCRIGISRFYETLLPLNVSSGYSNKLVARKH